jgi:succinylglutamate desuccinylase/aspartoacylase family protein
MICHRHVVCLLCALSLLISCASGHHVPYSEQAPAVRDIAAIQQGLEDAVAASPFLSIRELGRVTYNGFQAPIWIIDYKKNPSPRYRVLINAGIHGNEPAGVACMLAFVETLSNKPEIFPDHVFDIIPIINPWGWQHDIRFNQDGIDINRDFASLRSQEAKLIQSYVDDHQYDLMIDLHEDPSASGFYLYQYGRKDTALSESIAETIRQSGYPLEQDFKMVILKTKNGVIDAPMWGLWYMKMTRQLSIANYYRLNNSQNVFTIETPVSLDMKHRLVMQCQAVYGLINHFIDTTL